MPVLALPHGYQQFIALSNPQPSRTRAVKGCGLGPHLLAVLVEQEGGGHLDAQLQL